MTKTTYDISIIGSGIAGSFAALRIAEKHPQANAILIDVGRPPMKRRRQLEGFLGCFPTGDGKIYPSDLDKVKDIVDGRKATPAWGWVYDYFKEVNPMKLTKSPKPLMSFRKKVKNAGFDISWRDYYQWKPASVHKLSKHISTIMSDAPNITYSFDNEVLSIRKQRGGTFAISTADGSISSHKVILCVGRSGWRWVTNLYDDLGIIASDDWARYGARIEMPAGHLKELKKSHFTIKNDELEVGPFCWNGTIIPEDHLDLVISAFRSNENRWKTEKVTFSLLKSVYFNDQGSVQTDRIGKLSFLLFNDRVSREKVKTFLAGKSQLNLIPEYNWMPEVLGELENLFPKLCKKGYLHVPNIDPIAAKIRLGSNLESEIDGMFVAGESSGIKGIAAAAIMGTVCADSACK